MHHRFTLALIASLGQWVVKPLTMFPFAVAIFLGAFLLFLVQPLFGRFVLPWFGGAPAAWTTCLLFFQSALLAGYAYAHLLSKHLSVKRQVALHLGLLAGALLWLPPIPAEHWKPVDGLAPTGRLLGLLATQLGVPFILLSATGPLVQRWFHLHAPDRSPYRLYALSNAGSLLALVAYPFVIEPRWGRVLQAEAWAIGFLFWFAALAWCGRLLWRANTSTREVAKTPVTSPPPPLKQRLGWVAWPTLASVLLVSTSTALTLDVAAVPFLWVAPLVIYLLTFVICFDHPRWYHSRGYSGALVVAAALLVDLLAAGTAVSFNSLILTHLSVLFVACMVCHGEVFASRPAADRLTGYYLHVATGGALGSLLVAVFAPLLFDRYLELPLAWLACAVVLVVRVFGSESENRVRSIALGAAACLVLVPFFRAFESMQLREEPWRDFWDAVRAMWGDSRGLILAAALSSVVVVWPRSAAKRPGVQWGLRLLALLVPLWVGSRLAQRIVVEDEFTVLSARSFHGVHTVADYNLDSPQAASRFLAHGSTTHGIQLLHPDFRRWPTSYYSPDTGIGLAMFRPQQHAERQIGVLGLGVGTMAAYAQEGDTLRFYEIDSEVVRIAQSAFSFLSDSPAKVEIVSGDGRLVLEREAQQARLPKLDLLSLDAFSGDGVPIHLLTREAFDIYLARLADDGVLAINTSNRTVNLEPVVRAHAEERGLFAVTVFHRPQEENWWAFPSQWMLLARHPAVLDTPDIRAAAKSWADERPPFEPVLWTDDHASLWPVLR